MRAFYRTRIGYPIFDPSQG